jgi:hypothetical protein
MSAIQEALAKQLLDKAAFNALPPLTATGNTD